MHHVGRGIVLIPYLKKYLETMETSSSYLNIREFSGECFALIQDARVNLGIIEYGANNVYNNDCTTITTENNTSSSATTFPLTTTARRYQRGLWYISKVEDDVEIINEIQQCISIVTTMDGIGFVLATNRHSWNNNKKKNDIQRLKESMNENNTTKSILLQRLENKLIKPKSCIEKSTTVVT
jgi:hypothetical protein